MITTTAKGWVRRFSFFFCLFTFYIWLLPVAIGAKPAKNEILAIGTAKVQNGNLAQAKEAAISDALVKGVEYYILRRLGGEGAANNFRRIVYEITPSAREKIENFNILVEDKTEEEYQVLLRLRVNEKVIDKSLRDAGVFVAEGPPVKVLFLVSEEEGGTTYYWWKDPETHTSLSRVELVLHNVFRQRGLSPVNRSSIISDSTGDAEYLKHVNLRDEDALEWGKLFSTDVVICGQIEVVDKKEASLTLKALDVNQGALISRAIAFEQVEKGPDGKPKTSEAIERLVNRLALKLIPAINRFSASDRGRVRHLEVTLKGLSSYKQFRVFRDFLRRDVAGVESVRQTRVRKDDISIAVEFKGDREAFVHRVMHHENLPFLLKLDQDEKEVILFRISEFQ